MMAKYKKKSLEIQKTKAGYVHNGSGLLICTLAEKNNGDSLEEYFNIKQDRLVLGVIQIQKNHLPKTKVTSSGNLPESCHTRFSLRPVPEISAEMIPLLQEFEIKNRQRAGPDKAHLALKNIEELWQFVNTVAAYEPADFGEARVVLDLEQRAVGFIQVNKAFLDFISLVEHTPEFVKFKRLITVAKRPLLCEKHRAA